MSVAVMSAVWNLDLPPTEKLVMLAFADYANDEGQCYPSTDRIAHKSGISARHARRVVKEMIRRGLIQIEEPGGGRGNRRIVRVCPQKGDRMSVFRARERGTSDAERGTRASTEPLEEPSGTSTDSSLRSESDANGASRMMKANELVAAWVDLQPYPPSKQHRGKQAAAAKRLCDHYPADIILAAAAGMPKMFPHSKGEPWDIMTLERKFSKAVQKELDGSDPPDEWDKYLPKEDAP